MVEHQLPKLTVRVRFPSSAPSMKAQVSGRLLNLGFVVSGVRWVRYSRRIARAAIWRTHDRVDRRRRTLGSPYVDRPVFDDVS
jgi:hypothetical protein